MSDQIRAVIEAQGIKIYTPPVEEDDEHAATHARSLMAAMPFAVIGSEKDVKANDGRVVKGRQYAWGVAEVENEDHCDFKKLRSILIRTHMLDLIHTTEESHYEAYRAQQMETRKFGEARPRKLDNPKFKEEEENLRKRFTEQVKVEEQRFRQWEQKLISERDRLNKDLEATHAAYVHDALAFRLSSRTDCIPGSNHSSRRSKVSRAPALAATVVARMVDFQKGSRRTLHAPSLFSSL
jgi:cell division control protein 12